MLGASRNRRCGSGSTAVPSISSHMKLFLVFTVAVVSLASACSSSEEPETTIVATTTTTPEVESVVKSPEQELVETLWDRQASRPGANIERVFNLYRQKAAVGPRNIACWDPELVEVDLCAELVNAMALLDVPLSEIVPLLDSLELPWRLVGRDCEPQAVTLDIQAGRVNLETIDDVVVAYTVERAEGKWDRVAVEREICVDSPEGD